MIPSRFERSIRNHCVPLAPKPTELAPRLQRLSDVEAVLFDVYGTMLISASGDIGTDSKEHKIHAARETMDMFKIDTSVPAAELIRKLEQSILKEHATLKARGVKYPEVVIAEIWQDVLCGRPGAEEIDVEHFALEFELRVNPTWPMPDLESALSSLRSHGVILGIVSNAQFFTPVILATLMNKSLDELGFRSELSYFSYEHRQAKPGSFLYQEARERFGAMGISPSNVVYVGNDMLNDVVAAGSVGFRTALFAGDSRSLRLREGDERVDGIEPDVIITSLLQLIDCLST